jgi:dihydrofolate reductase
MNRFSVIVGMFDEGRGIGVDGKIPWECPEDLKNFSRVTTYVDPEKMMANPELKNVVLMGSATWKSIGQKPLPNRINAIMTSEPDTYSKTTGIWLFNYNEVSLEEAVETLYQNKMVNHVFVIGGVKLYEAAVKSTRCENIFLTRIMSNPVTCDRFMPEFESDYELKSTSSLAPVARSEMYLTMGSCNTIELELIVTSCGEDSCDLICLKVSLS